MGLTVLPPSQPPRGRAAASRACATRLRLDPACIGSSAASKGPKRLGSCRDGDPPTKRRRTGEDAGAGSAEAMSLEDKHGVNRLLLSLLPPGRSPNEVIPLSDSIVRVLQENGTRCHGVEGDEIEIDVYALGDEALRVIKDRVGAYLEGRAGLVEAPEQSEGVIIGHSASRSIPSESASKIVLSEGASKKIIPSKSASCSLSKAASNSIPSEAAPEMIQSKAASRSILPRAPPSSIPLRRPTSIPPRPAPTSILPRPKTKSIPSISTTKSTPLRTVTSPPVPRKPSKSRGFVSEHLETAISQSSPKSTLLTASQSLPEPSEPSRSKKSIKELIAAAGEVMKKVVRQREIEQLRAAARQELEKMVRTVEFNDPYIDVQDAFK